ncbi:LCP family protein [Blastococcus sp. TF02A-26]|uniref:LCP family protein n=1 Tax=Blastococcus sp. TF02A-26 TaxID=2250577 RepID=UPI000DEBD3D0|nr:LCP family protein [Blastococcus sp. TF02A-26]RBY89842.1 LytR family transcriptional regulator [Blastococcus sp. TF02A-26]
MSPKKPVPPGESGDRPLPARLDPRLGRSGSGRSSRSDSPAAERRPRAAGPRTPRVTVLTRVAAGVVSAVLLATTGWGWYLGQLAEASVNRTDAIPDSGNEDDGAGGEAMNMLLVGSDSRADLTPAQLAELNAGEDSGLNTDTVILVHIPADGSRASFVSFPRDSYVNIPGHGWGKLNSAYAYGYSSVDDSMPEADRQAGGAQLLVQTIHDLTGLQIDHYAEVDLLGFFELSNVVGGVEVNLCAAVDDRAFSGAFFPAGPQTIAGADALKFVRQRHGINGDYDRIIRQQVFIAGVLRNMISSDVLLDPGKQRELVEAASSALTVDQGLDLFSLARQMQSVQLDSIEFQTVPYVAEDRIDGVGSVIQLEDEDVLHQFFAELSAEPEPEAPAEAPEPPATVDPSQVSVEVLNGSGTSGLARTAGGELETAGFVLAGTGNADSSDYTQTVIRHVTGDEALAATLAGQVPGAVVEVDDTLTSGTVQLVLGSDFNGVGVATTAQPAPDEVVGEDLRTADDQTCIN